MPTVVGIRFRRSGRMYYFDPGGLRFSVNDYAVVETSNHLEMGRVVLAETDIAEGELNAEDLRLATRHLGSIVGKVDVEEILGSIFQDFCIGK